MRLKVLISLASLHAFGKAAHNRVPSFLRVITMCLSQTSTQMKTIYMTLEIFLRCVCYNVIALFAEEYTHNTTTIKQHSMGLLVYYCKDELYIK